MHFLLNAQQRSLLTISHQHFNRPKITHTHTHTTSFPQRHTLSGRGDVAWGHRQGIPGCYYRPAMVRPIDFLTRNASEGLATVGGFCGACGWSLPATRGEYTRERPFPRHGSPTFPGTRQNEVDFHATFTSFPSDRVPT